MSWLRSSSSANSLKDSKQNNRPRTTSAASSKQANSMNNTSQNAAQNAKPTRVIASGTVYLTHTLAVPTLPSTCTDDDGHDQRAASLSVRARKVTRARGGPAINVLSILAQFNHPHHPPSSTKLSKNPPQIRNSIECALVAPLGGAGDGKTLLHELELEGVRTRFARVHPNAGIPGAWILDTDDPITRAVINHNPLPELTHEDFVALLGPILVPEHYNGLQTHHWHSHPSLPQFPPTHAVYGPGPGLPPPIPPLPEHQQTQNQLPSPPLTSPPPPLPPNTPGLPHNPPFTILHFTGRHKEADKITLLNVTGVDSLARHRFWRDKTTFALDCTGPVGDLESRRAREAVFRHVDVVFFSKAYALSTTVPNTEEPTLTPRAFLLSQVPHVAPHALLFVHWGSEGSAVLSVPTREYLQCAAWTLPLPTGPSPSTSQSTTSVSPLPRQDPFPTTQQQTQELQPPHERPETQLSLGSSDPRYKELSPVAPPFPFPGHQRLDSSNYTTDSSPTSHTDPQWMPSHNTEYSVDSLGGMAGTGMEEPTDWDDVYSGMGVGVGAGSASALRHPSRQMNGNIDGNHLNIQMNAPLASSSVHEHIDSIGNALEDECSTYGHEPWSGRGRSRERGRNTNRDAVIYDSDSSLDEYGEVGDIAGIGLRNNVNSQGNAGVNRGEIRVSGVTVGYSYSEDSYHYPPNSHAQGQEHGQDFNTNVGGAGMVGIALAPSDIDSEADAEAAAAASRFVLENRSRREKPKLFDHRRGESDALEPYGGHGGGGEEDEEDEDLTEGEEKAKAPTRIGRKRRERMRADADAEERIQQEPHAVEQHAHREEELKQGEEDDEQPFEEETVEGGAIPSAPRVEEKTLPLVLEAWMAGLIYSLTRHVLPGKPYVPGGEAAVPKGPATTSKRKTDFSEWEWKWRLDECLRFAAELAGRGALRGTHEGLALTMGKGV